MIVGAIIHYKGSYETKKPRGPDTGPPTDRRWRQFHEGGSHRTLNAVC
jgi:hypothetical protein